MKKICIVLLVTGGWTGLALSQEAPPPAAVPAWVESVSFSGDLRLRYDGTRAQDEPVRNRGSYRVRLRAKAQVVDGLQAMLGLRTGGKNPVSADQTLGDGFSSDDVGFELAFLEWRPEALPGLVLSGGKINKPFFRVCDLVWDGDLNPEGAALRYGLELGPAQLLLNGAALAVTERSRDSDTYLYLGQAGLDYRGADGFKMLAGISYYHYQNMRDFGVIDWSHGFKGYGNTVREITDDEGRVVQAIYENEYHELEFLAAIGFNCPWTGLPWGFYGNYVRNIEVDDDDTGYQAGVRVRGVGRLNPMSLDYSYRYLEADAVVGAFSDSVAWGGGTDGQGHKLAAAYRIMEHLALRASLYLDRKGLSADEASRDYKRVLVDITASF